MKQSGAMNGGSTTEDKIEAWAKRVVMFIGLVGPLTLVGVLLWMVNWDASQSSRAVHQAYLPSAYVNAVTNAEQPIETF